jgi:membrane-associated phospholipid phosphatase
MSKRPTLEDVGVRREIRLGGLTLLGRRRRPSGEADPLPRPLRASGRFWLFSALVVVVVWVLLDSWSQTEIWWTKLDLEVLGWFESIRTDGATAVMERLHALGSPWTYRVLRFSTIAILIAVRRWRHLVALGGSVIFVMWLVPTIAEGGRPRPYGIEIIGDWEGFAHPSLPVAALTVTLVSMALALIPHGRWRTRALWAGSTAAAFLAVARMYLGVDHPTDAWVGYLIGFSVPFLAFRWYAPENVYPVRWGRGRTAHLAITPRRLAAIRHAIRDQIGFEVLEVEPFALEGSAGSTPLKITVEGHPPKRLFGKLYANTHLRSDRWYKIGRTILYGALEDEVPFSSVRRLVEYEDYMLRLMRDEGFTGPEPYGFVELTAEREYVILMGFLEGAREIGDVEVTEAIADDALAKIQELWACGIAHRDLKPANVMVVGDEVVIIDVAFTTIRPSPWRQAVDLANMILILSLSLDPQVVYRIAQRYFAPADVAEAFAATKGVTIPSQLRAALKRYRDETGVDLVELWCDITPDREPIVIQRWSAGRIAATARVAAIALVVLALLLDNVIEGGLI